MRFTTYNQRLWSTEGSIMQNCDVIFWRITWNMAFNLMICWSYHKFMLLPQFKRQSVHLIVSIELLLWEPSIMMQKLHFGLHISFSFLFHILGQRLWLYINFCLLALMIYKFSFFMCMLSHSFTLSIFGKVYFRTSDDTHFLLQTKIEEKYNEYSWTYHAD